MQQENLISNGGMKIPTLTPEKIKNIMEWPIPQNVVDIWSFMGLARYHRWFIEGFPKVVYPITSLKKKGRIFKWAIECQRSFDKLKQLLTTSPILRIVDPKREFGVSTNAYKEGVGGVLMQEENFVAYESQKLKELQEKYSAYYVELTTVIHVLKRWRHYFLGKIFLLITDHNSLSNYFKQTTLIFQQVRWISFVSEFEFEIKHFKGKENQVADALS